MRWYWSSYCGDVVLICPVMYVFLCLCIQLKSVRSATQRCIHPARDQFSVQVKTFLFQHADAWCHTQIHSPLLCYCTPNCMQPGPHIEEGKVRSAKHPCKIRIFPYGNFIAIVMHVVYRHFTCAHSFVAVKVRSSQSSFNNVDVAYHCLAMVRNLWRLTITHWNIEYCSWCQKCHYLHWQFVLLLLPSSLYGTLLM